MKRKSSAQLQALEDFYAEQKYPTHEAMGALAMDLNLTPKQVLRWFVEKRRRDKINDDLTVPSSRPSKKFAVSRVRNGLGAASASAKIVKERDALVRNMVMCSANLPSKCKRVSSVIKENVGNRKRRKRKVLQDLMAPEQILSKIFRKDGPSLGVEFDSLPRGFPGCKDSGNSLPACEEGRRAYKRRKDCSESVPVKKHGIGKGLMTVWWATNPNGGEFPPGIIFSDRQETNISPVSCKPPRQNRKQQSLSAMIQRSLRNKLQDKKKPSLRRRELGSKDDEVQKHLRRQKCELALEKVMAEDCPIQCAMLMDDEDLELRELQAGPNPLTCSDHCATNGLYGCSLCKDLLAKFPPNSVKMKQPFTSHPWNSSTETVKKLFKVFHFLYTYSVTVDICTFTLDEFAQAFHDKDSLLLGKIHVALLKLLLSDVQAEMSSGFPLHLSISCKFLALLHSVEDQEFLVELWKNSLNPLTWTEILCQVLVAAGFASKQGSLRRDALSKEMSLMVKYGLRPGTLKGELFRLLSKQGNNGLKISDLAKSMPIAELNLAGTAEELQLLISSTLSSDITLFEKISSCAFRLRINALTKEANDFQSDSEDSGSVDDDFHDSGTCSSSDSECDSENSSPRKVRCITCHGSEKNKVAVHNEIDESYAGEVWLLGLMEGEYSDLSIEEKLNAMVALIDLVGAGSSIRMEDSSTRPCGESVPSLHRYGSGAKIKRTSNQSSLSRPSWVHMANNAKGAHTSSEFHPVDSSVLIVKCHGEKNSSSKKGNTEETESESYLHPMQSIFLGSDRRYNRYWLFLGPCNEYDPGHKRVYFESSEDGHWEVIDTEEALRTLLSVLDDRGKREALLIESLEKREAFLCQEMSCKMLNSDEIRQVTQSDQSELDLVRQESSPVSDVDNNLSLSQTEITKDSLPAPGAIVLEAGKKGEEEHRKWIRLQELDAWIWNYFYCDLNAVKNSKRSYYESLTRCGTCHDLYWRDEKHCKICHMTFEIDFDLEEKYAIHSATCREEGDGEMFPKHKILPSQLQALKAAVHAIESVMPEGALVGAWTKSAHRLWIKRLRRTSSLAELLQVVADFVAAVNEDWLNAAEKSNMFMEEIVACFPNMPQTSSALALWLVKLDDLISPYLQRIQPEKK